MLRALLLTFLLAGLVAYVPSALLAVRTGHPGVLIADTVIYLAVVVAFFARRIGFAVRTLVMLAVVYTLGTFLLVAVGPFGSGTLWLFSFPVFAGALLGARAAVAGVALNVVTLLALQLAGEAAFLSGAGWTRFPRPVIPVLIVNFVLLGSAAAVSVAMLVGRLEQSADEERATRRALDADRRELVALNEVVSSEMEERLAAERQRALLEDQLRQAQKMEAIGRLAGGVAHDFNNLLTAILGHVSLALRGRDDPARLRRRLEEIERAAERAAGLTQQLLAFSRKQVLQPRVIDLNDAVRDMQGILRRLIGEDVELAVSLAPGPLAVHADPTQLQQVVMNLAVNARDAMPRGGRLAIETGREAGGGGARDHVTLTVTDTGVGMDAGTRQRAFEPFFTTKPAGEGTGLGLATVYGIVTQSEGTV
jgi:signal transduction histidine kinase